MKKNLLSVPVLLCLLSATALPQKPTYPKPPPPLGPDDTTQPQTPVEIPRRVDLQKIKNEAEELARTAQTIPADVASVRKGMLPKDIIQKLKEIEKLSKRMRSQLNP